MNPKKSEVDLLVEISAKLDEVIALMRIAGKDENRQIEILRNLGYKWHEIGQLVGIKPDAARKRVPPSGP